jgi:hypothetical protein
MFRSMLRSLTRGLTRRPSPARKAPAARSWQPALEELETRLVPTVSVSVLNGVLTAQCSNTGSNLVQVDHVVKAGKGFADINGHLFSDASYNSIRINGGAGGTRTDILGNVKPLTVFGDSNNDEVDLGNASRKLQGIQGKVLLEEAKGFTATVNIHDEGDATIRSVFLNTVTGAKGASLGQLTGVGAANIQWDYHGTAAVNVDLGAGAKTVFVLGTGVTTNVSNVANSTIDVGDGSLARIQAPLTLENEVGHDALAIDDRLDVHGQTYTMTTIPGDEFINTFEQITASVMGQNGSITFDNADTANLDFIGGTGGNLFNIEKTGVTTTVNGGSGANTFEVGSNNLGSDIVGQLTLNGGGNARTAMSLLDINNPNSETYNFNISQAGTGSLALASTPSFSLKFNNMNNFVDLSTNGFSTVNDPSGTVNVVF